jgi:tetratricopeptide (TPR) repeat protein
MMRNLLFSWITLSFFVVHFAQETQKTRSPYSTYYRGVELFEKEQYTAARIEFDLFLLQNLDRNDPFVVNGYYYRGMSALHVYNDDAIPLLESFIRDYPENTYQNQIQFEIANYYFQKEDYENASAYYLKTESQSLDSSDQERYFFKKGYSCYQQNLKAEAIAAFKPIKDSQGPYGIISLYYFAHLNYLTGNLDIAKTGFHRLKHATDFKTIAPYYIVQINHKQQNYDSVIAYAPSVLDTADLGNYNDILHLLGDSYYKTERFKEASTYLKQYNDKTKTSRAEDYQLGDALMKSGDPETAILYLERAARMDDSLGQTAMYEIGSCYLKHDKLLPARNAFEKASTMKTLGNVAEDALYQFAVISFKIDINPYDESVRAFEQYLNKYPNSSRKNDIFQYLVNVYASTSNYEKALASLNKIPNKDQQLKTVYQTVAFNLGVDLFQKGLIDSAYSVMNLVEKYQEEPELIAKSRYWRADILFRKGKFQESIKEFKRFLSSPSVNLLEEKNDAYYSMGYAYLSLDQLSDAMEYFGIYCQSDTKNAEKHLDALFQLSDGNYQQGKDEQAILYYKKIIALNSDLTDRALFYLAKSYGYNKQAALKISTLESLLSTYPNSKYVQNATYELAMSFKSQSEFNKAYAYFEKYLDQYPQSPKRVNCRIEMADIYYKQGNYELSEGAYRSILMEYGNKPDICAVAAKGLMDVYLTLKKPESAEQVANEYDCAGLSSDEKENLYYNPALQSYVDSNYQDAIPKFSQYLTKFPQGKFAYDAHFYLANCFLRTQDTAQAVPHYETYLSGPVSNYFEPVSLRLAAYFYENKEFTQANTYYQLLEKHAAKPNNINAAKLGIMRCSFLLENHEKAKEYAQQVRMTPGLAQNLKIEAEYAYGMSAYYLKDYTSSSPSLRWIVKNTTTVKASEAKYALANIQFSNLNMDSCIILVKELVKMKPSYNYWVAKGLILQTKALIEQEKYVEADQTITSVIDFYPAKEEDGVLEEAKEVKQTLDALMNPQKPEEENLQKTLEIKPE